uniref:Uncharacterized protein n=1 Tax=Glossina austeni TaxID=7395 RepID=A0A1A9VR95_GLOAU
MKFQVIFFCLFAILVVSQAHPHGCEHTNEEQKESPNSDLNCPMGEEELFDDDVSNDETSSDAAYYYDSEDTPSGDSMNNETLSEEDRPCS